MLAAGSTLQRLLRTAFVTVLPPTVTSARCTLLFAVSSIAQRDQRCRHRNEAAHLHARPAFQLQQSSRSIAALPHAAWLCASALERGVSMVLARVTW